MSSSPPPLLMEGVEAEGRKKNVTPEEEWMEHCVNKEGALGMHRFMLEGERRNLSEEDIIQGSFCKHTWDGWLCWPDTPAAHTVVAPCPDFVPGFDQKRLAHKECDSNGTWYRHWASDMPWSNYTNCVDIDSLMWEKTVIFIYQSGYLISLVALLISLGILFYFKSLRCARTTLHMNLFSSFACNNLLWLLWYALVVERPDVAAENGIGCRVLDVVLHYFLVSNYCWMLCEGVYLHTLLVATFVRETWLLRGLFALGWGLPAVAVLVYGVGRATAPAHLQESTSCWVYESPYKIAVTVPVAAAIGLNIIFMINIVRVVVRKLLAGPRVGTARPSSTMLQALRATLLLVPLLGLQYMLTPFKPANEHEYFPIYEVTLAITASFQGLCVATLFCFCNGEVIQQIKRRWQHLMFRPRANSCTATTVSVSQSKPVRRSTQIHDPRDNCYTSSETFL